MSDAHRSPPTCPEAVLRLIPRYPELEDEERGLVEAHAAGCAACREQTEVLHGDLAPPPVDEEKLLAQTLARIALADSLRNPRRDRSSRSHDLLWRGGPRWATAATALLALGASASLGAVLQRNLGEAPPVAEAALYETALDKAVPEAKREDPSTQTADGSSQRAQLEVVFRSGVAIDRVTQVLRAVGGEIVGGPSPLGRYSIALQTHSDAAAVARMLRDEKAGVVAYAEPALE